MRIGTRAASAGNAADVIGVVVRDHEIVDAREAGLSNNGRNTVGVAAVEAHVAGVHQQRFAGGRHDQRGLTAFDVDDMDVERLFWLRSRQLGRPRERSGHEQAEEVAHGAQV